MRRLLRFVLHAVLIVVAAIVGFVAVDMAAMPGSDAAPSLINGVIAGTVGLVFGLAAAWLRGIPWRLLPVLVRFWMRRLSQEFWWVTAGSAAVAVLVFY